MPVRTEMLLVTLRAEKKPGFASSGSPQPMALTLDEVEVVAASADYVTTARHVVTPRKLFMLSNVQPC